MSYSSEEAELLRQLTELQGANAKLRAQNDALRLVLSGMSTALNSARLIMADKEARDYAGELVKAAETLLDKGRA